MVKLLSDCKIKLIYGRCESFLMKWGKLILVILFIVYILFIYVDVFNHISYMYINIIKYIGIILCFILSLITNSKDHIIDSRLLQIGMLFTTFADLALVILENYIVGVVLFTIVQLIYIARYTTDRFKLVFKKLLVVFIIIFSSYFIISGLIIKTSLILIPIGLFYAVCLITSVFKGVAINRDSSYINPNKYMIAFGMVLFLLCDMSIGVAFILRITNMLNLSYLFSSLIWIFYLPSQILLSISGHKEFK